MTPRTKSRLHRRTIMKTLGALLILSVAWVLTTAPLQADDQDWCEGYCAAFCRDKGGCNTVVVDGNTCRFSCNRP